MLRQIFQLLKLISLKDLPKALNHYESDGVVQHYQNLRSLGLYHDEMEVLDIVKQLNVNKILIVGAGAGREALVFSNYCSNVIAYEPVTSMYRNLSFPQNISFVSELETINEKVDVIFVSSFITSFLTHNEREKFYTSIFRLVNPSGNVFIRPDIMKLSIVNSTKFYLAYLILKFKFFNLPIKKGDTIRSTLDKEFTGSQLAFYHYYEDEFEFLNEVKNYKLQGKALKLGFYNLRQI